jgi:thiol:disulfide interchange protein
MARYLAWITTSPERCKLSAAAATNCLAITFSTEPDMTKLLKCLTAAMLLLCAVGAANAQTPFTTKALAAAQAGGKPVLVHVHADWCPNCAAQKKILAKLLKQPQLKAFQVLQVDFDTQTDVVKALGVRYQSTLIVYKGGTEVGRSTGNTSEKDIAALLKKAV